MDTLPDLGEGVPLQVQFHRLHTVGERPAHVLLLRAEGHGNALGGQRLQVPTDGTQTTVEDVKGKVLSGQRRALVQRLVGHAHHLPPRKAATPLLPWASR